MGFKSDFKEWMHSKLFVGPQRPKYEPTPHAYTCQSSAEQITALLPTAPTLEVQRYSDANYAVSRASEARKIHVMGRICAINNAAAEDVIDRKGTTVRPPAKPWAVIPMTEQELDDAINLVEVTYVMENAHDPRQ